MIRKMFLIFCCLAISGTGFSSTFTFKEGDGNPYSDSDITYINQHLPAEVLGNETTMFTDTYPRTKLFIKFDDFIGNNSGQIAPNSEIVSAKLFLWVQNRSVGTHNVYNLTSDFDENTLTWNGTYTYDPTAVTSYVPSTESHYISIDVTSSVVDWLNGTTDNYGWLIENTADDGSNYYTDDADYQYRPFLELSDSTVPEPLSIVLMIPSLLFLFKRYRSRK